MKNCGYKLKSSQSLTSQHLLRMKCFENECCIFSMFVLQDRHNFVLILVKWLTEKRIMICCFISRSFFSVIMKCFISGTICKICYILKIKLLHLWEYLKNCHFFTESAAFPGKFENLLLLLYINYVKLKLFNQLLQSQYIVANILV